MFMLTATTEAATGMVSHHVVYKVNIILHNSGCV